MFLILPKSRTNPHDLLYAFKFALRSLSYVHVVFSFPLRCRILIAFDSCILLLTGGRRYFTMSWLHYVYGSPSLRVQKHFRLSWKRVNFLCSSTLRLSCCFINFYVYELKKNSSCVKARETDGERATDVVSFWEANITFDVAPRRHQ